MVPRCQMSRRAYGEEEPTIPSSACNLGLVCAVIPAPLEASSGLKPESLDTHLWGTLGEVVLKSS